MKKLILLFFVLLGVGSFASAEDFEKTVEEGNKLYAEASFKAAAMQYQKVVDAGYVSSSLLYNLGNAYYKQKMYAKAILYYEKALILNPSDSQIRNNLEFARYQTKDKIEVVPSFIVKEWYNSFRDLFSANGWAWVSLFTLLLSGIFFILYRFTGSITMKKLNFWAACFLLLVFVCSVLNSSYKTNKIKQPDSAIIQSPVVVVKSSPDQSGKDLFVLHDGTKVTFTETAPVPGWREVKIADGNTGWIPTSTFEII